MITLCYNRDMATWKENLDKMLRTMKVRKVGNTVEIDLGRIPMNDPSVLIFPEGTDIRVDGIDRVTQKGEEFLAREWCNGENMTWGHLSTAKEVYFKALNSPSEIRDLQILPPAKK